MALRLYPQLLRVLKYNFLQSACLISDFQVSTLDLPSVVENSSPTFLLLSSVCSSAGFLGLADSHVSLQFSLPIFCLQPIYFDANLFSLLNPDFILFLHLPIYMDLRDTKETSGFGSPQSLAGGLRSKGF